MFISIADGSAQTRIRRINMFLEKIQIMRRKSEGFEY